MLGKSSMLEVCILNPPLVSSFTAVLLNSTGAKVHWGANVDGSEKIWWSESSHSFSFLEWKFPGAKVLRNKILRSECSLLGTFAPGRESTEERKGHNSMVTYTHEKIGAHCTDVVVFLSGIQHYELMLARSQWLFFSNFSMASISPFL